MSENYDNHPHPIWAKFFDGKLDLQTAFWGYLIAAACYFAMGIWG